MISGRRVIQLNNILKPNKNNLFGIMKHITALRIGKEFMLLWPSE
jgi:hypothetical protein